MEDIRQWSEDKLNQLRELEAAAESDNEKQLIEVCRSLTTEVAALKLGIKDVNERLDEQGG
jgi:hypothetical protein